MKQPRTSPESPRAKAAQKAENTPIVNKLEPRMKVIRGGRTSDSTRGELLTSSQESPERVITIASRTMWKIADHPCPLPVPSLISQTHATSRVLHDQPGITHGCRFEGLRRVTMAGTCYSAETPW